MLKSKFSKIGKKEQPHELPKYAQEVERTVDDIRRLATEVQKGLQQYVLFNKRNKKLPEHQLATLLTESIDKGAGDGSMFQETLQSTVDITNSLTEFRKNFEAKVDKSVFVPLHQLTEETCATIAKGRRSLNKASADVASAREQFQKATSTFYTSTEKLSSGSSDSQSAAATASQRLQQAQNLIDEKTREHASQEATFLRELYSFAMEEDKYALVLVEYLRLQQAYFEQSLNVLKRTIPEMVSKINKRRPIAAFSTHLPKHLTDTGRTISYVLETCITYLDNEATLQSEGLFRRPGSKLRTELLVKALNLMRADDQLLATCDCMTVASALKQYLFSLPEPLVTYSFAEQWASASKTPGSTSVELVKAGLETMPIEFRHNLAYLCLFLSRLASQSKINKMTPDNLAIVIAPSLYRLLNTPSNPFMDGGNRLDHRTTELERSLDFLNNSGPGVGLVELLITNANKLFEQDMAFIPTPRGPPSSSARPALRPPPIPIHPVETRLQKSVELGTISANSSNSTRNSKELGLLSHPSIREVGRSSSPTGRSSTSPQPLASKKRSAPRPPVPPSPACASSPIVMVDDVRCSQGTSSDSSTPPLANASEVPASLLEDTKVYGSDSCQDPDLENGQSLGPQEIVTPVKDHPVRPPRPPTTIISE